jgi:predicted transcriptional regulator
VARPPSPTLTESERAILEVLWRLKKASVREVTDELAKTRPVAYTTVLTMLGILDKKGLVSYEAEGRAYIYQPVITRQEARSSALRHLIAQFFNGSPEVLAQHLLSEHELDWNELDELRRELNAGRVPSRGKKDE